MPEPEGKPQSERWREDYRKNRYLAQKPERHLTERYRYLNECVLTLTETGQMGVEGRSRLGLWLWAKITHLFYEYELRGLGLPGGMLDEAILPKPTFPARAVGADAYTGRARKEEGQIFKFGSRKWIEPMLRLGSFRFAPASYYHNANLGYATRDDELQFTIYPGKESSRGLPDGMRLPPGADWLTIRHPTDYYLQCFTTRYALRLYGDFNADCCLVIYDGREFGRRLLPPLREKFPDWFVTSAPVSYVDPDDPGSEVLLIPRVKHLRYAYQNEERILCHPKTVITQPLSPFTVEIGSLEDIAEIIPTELQS